MKKDIFGGKVKQAYVGYILFFNILFELIWWVAGALLLYSGFQQIPGSFDQIFFFVAGFLLFLIAILYLILSTVVIRAYPKYPKLRRLLFDSDFYFVGCDSKEYHGHWRGREVFYLHTLAAELYNDWKNVKYPKSYRVCVAWLVVCIVLMFAWILSVALVMENISMLPKAIQSEGLIMGLFFVVEAGTMISVFVLAFRIRKIRLNAYDEYKRNQLLQDQEPSEE